MLSLIRAAPLIMLYLIFTIAFSPWHKAGCALYFLLLPLCRYFAAAPYAMFLFMLMLIFSFFAAISRFIFMMMITPHHDA